MPKGKYVRTSFHRKRMSEGQKLLRESGFHSPTEFKNGNKHLFWKGGCYSYFHATVYRLKKKTPCIECGTIRVELVFKDHKAGRGTPRAYTTNPEDYIWLCRKCHFKRDGRGKYFAECMRKAKKAKR